MLAAALALPPTPPSNLSDFKGSILKIFLDQQNEWRKGGDFVCWRSLWHQPPGPTPPQESLYMYSIHCIHCCRYNQPPGPTPPTQKSLYIHLVVVLMLDLVLILQYVAQHQVQHQHHKRSYTYTVAGTICTNLHQHYYSRWKFYNSYFHQHQHKRCYTFCPVAALLILQYIPPTQEPNLIM